jgi:hypothetical protein
MKQSILTFFAFLITINIVTAQGFDNNEKVQEMRVKFYNEHLQFTDAEKQSFWPLFEQFKNDEKSLKKQFKPNQRFELMSDAQAEEYILKSLDHEEQLIDLKRQYVKKMMQVIPVRKVAMLNRTERQFKRKILNEVKRKRQQQSSN